MKYVEINFGILRDWGKNALEKKITKGSSGLYMYAGFSKVVITNMSPMKMIYHTKTQKALLSFYIQRYNHEDVAVDAALQSRLNGE